MTRVVVLGAGPAGAQIACDYALGGCSVVWVDDDRAAAEERIEQSLGLAAQHGLAEPPDIARARTLLASRSGPAGSEGRVMLVVEALPEDAELKASALGELAGLHPEALIATTSALADLNALAEGAEAGERTLCTHYVQPALLAPLVELTAAARTPPRLMQRVAQLLKAIGKRPVLLACEAPGMLGDRLRLALLRECLSLVARGVASAEQVDEVVRDGLARSWRHIGPLAQAAVAGAAELESQAAAVFPSLASERGAEGAEAALADALGSSSTGQIEQARAVRERLEGALAQEMREERAARALHPG